MLVNDSILANLVGVHQTIQQGVHHRGNCVFSILVNSKSQMDSGNTIWVAAAGGFECRSHLQDPLVQTTEQDETTAANQALQMCSNDVRLIRGYQLNSSFAPKKGYR